MIRGYGDDRKFSEVGGCQRLRIKTGTLVSVGDVYETKMFVFCFV